jgi:hypothetical protein
VRWIISFLVLLAGINQVWCQKSEPAAPPRLENILNYNVLQGSASSGLQTVLNNVAVQRLLLDIALKPRAEEYLDSALSATNVSAKQLLSHDLIRRDEGRYVINFFLFTRADEQRMREITESHAQMLASAILKRRTEIDAVLNQYAVSGVDSRAALFIMLGCFSLDWDGLALTAARGYRKSDSFLDRIFPRMILHGWEPPEPSKKGIYRGSHNTVYGSAELTSFGDHQIQPRRALPDILWNPGLYPNELKSKIRGLTESSSEKAVGKQIGLIMLSLRDGNKSLAELATVAETGEERTLKLADVLVELGYITRTGNEYSPRVPVLSSRDAVMVRKIRDIGREEMERWFESGCKQLHHELAELTPFRYGLKQTDFFYYIWHDIFGAANRILAESKLFADPYSEFYGAMGIIPAVFEESVYEEL